MVLPVAPAPLHPYHNLHQLSHKFPVPISSVVQSGPAITLLIYTIIHVLHCAYKRLTKRLPEKFHYQQQLHISISKYSSDFHQFNRQFSSRSLKVSSWTLTHCYQNSEGNHLLSTDSCARGYNGPQFIGNAKHLSSISAAP